jgi:hypothetical protein
MPWWSCHENRFFFYFINRRSCTSFYEGLREQCQNFGTYPTDARVAVDKQPAVPAFQIRVIEVLRTSTVCGTHMKKSLRAATEKVYQGGA